MMFVSESEMAILVILKGVIVPQHKGTKFYVLINHQEKELS
jgi:hypothetical protein